MYYFLPFLLLLSLLATCIEVDISVPGFPDIARFFNVDESMVQLTITYNFLGFCISSLFYGPLSESYGRRKVMLYGNAFMCIGALGCFFAPNINWLIMARFIQGIGASTAVVLVFAMIADLYDSKKGMKLIGFTNAFLSSSMAVAPIIGGFINENIGWRGNYGIVAGLSLFALILQLLFLPESKKTFEPLDVQKVITNYKKLFTSTEFLSAALTPSFLFGSYMAYIAASSFLYMDSYGLSTMTFVAHQAGIIGSFALASIFSGSVIKSIGTHKSIIISISTCCFSSILLLGFGYLGIKSAFNITIPMVIFSIGFAVCYPIIFSNSLSIFPEMYGTASSVIMSLRALLVAGFTSLTSYLYNGNLIRVAIPIAIGIFISLALITKLRCYQYD